MIIGIPVQDGHDLTREILVGLQATIKGDTKVVLIDNDSTDPFPFIKLIDEGLIDAGIFNNKNKGFYYPIKQIRELYPDEELIGIMHNDLLIYEDGWDVRMAKCFEDDPKLGLVGLCGSDQIDAFGGRGAGTKCFFRGGEILVGDQLIKGQSQDAGARTHELTPAACLDSLFMMFRAELIDTIEPDWNNLVLGHFYDRIWPCRAIEQGWHVAVLGVECDHLGGMTMVANQRYFDDAKAWFDERGLPYENPETEMYLVAERRFIGEYKEQKAFFPCLIEEGYVYRKL